MAVEESKRLGLSWGRCCSVCCILLGVLFLLISAVYSLTMRIYLKAYYNSAHVAGLSVVVALFVISHHICEVRKSLGCCLRLFAITQTCLNLVYLLCNIVMAAGYIVISILSIHINFDYTVGAVFGCLNVIWLLYLMVTTCAATKGDRYMDYEVDVQFVWHSDSLGIANDMELFGYPAYGDMNNSTIKSTDKGSMGTNASLMSKKSNPYVNHKSASPSCEKCTACCKGTMHLCFGVVYFLVQLVLVVIFALSACHPAFIAADVYKYRDSGDLYTVSVPGHRPLALFIKCRGSGNDTIVYENGLGSMAMMAWDFLPKMLSDRYTVCITDRRGYGWSETYEYDNISLLVDDQTIQWSTTNTQFFVELVKQAGIQTPFYYIGHSYGGHHLTQVALNHPELVKGLIFLDSAHFSLADNIQDYLQVVNNVNAMGIFYILTETDWINVEEVLEGSVEMKSVSEYARNEVNVGFRSGYYFEAYYREHEHLSSYNAAAYEGIRRALVGQQIQTPTYVIDAGSYDPSWFPYEHFPNYNESLHYSYVPGASHTYLTLSERYGSVTSELIHLYIQYDTGVINDTVLSTHISDIICSSSSTSSSSSGEQETLIIVDNTGRNCPANSTV